MSKYKYDIFEAQERDKCPCCGKITDLFYMNEKREYINPLTNKSSFTHENCNNFDKACYECQISRQR